MSPKWSIGCDNCLHTFKRNRRKISKLKAIECPNCGHTGPHLVGTEYGLQSLGYSDQKEGFEFLFEPQEGGNAP